ncbi:MAG TPA: NotI family restriction endonuclease [Anaerohalosphaeraceae bacterium]|nr:NotI family restriction endonuclease [Anaerohalosphaeraceae bacterium]HPB92933.1 NotI family restriction endonuclease [Anaerohalosphaeraceae bacterium]
MEHLLAEVFGFPASNVSPEAIRYRKNRLCPFNNRVPSCTKDKANDPLGVCSIFSNNHAVITCPVRFRESWLIAEHAANFFFPENTKWTSLSEITLCDRYGKSAGNIDLVLVSYDDKGKVLDFGSLEIQAVYITGNIRAPFESYLEQIQKNKSFSWKGKPNYPKPDYLSSSRKRLVPQILYKGGIIKTWQKKQAVALQRSFYDTLPRLPQADLKSADLAWFIYDLALDTETQRFNLTLQETVYTEFDPAIEKIATPEPGPIDGFLAKLQSRLDEKLEGTPPDNYCINDNITT